jgi:hypothetical protein
MSFRSTRYLLIATLVASGCAPLPYLLSVNHDTLVAIDIALESDVALAGTPAARSHITMLRRFVRSSEVHDVSAALGTLMGSTNLSDLKLTAAGSHTETWKGGSATALLIDPSQNLRRLEERVADAVHLFSEPPIDATEFIVTPDRSPMEGDAIAAVENFVPDQSGVNFRPHLLVAPSQADAAKRLEGQPAAASSVVVRAVGLSVYQLGRTGTADRLLWTWTGEIGAR